MDALKAKKQEQEFRETLQQGYKELEREVWTLERETSPTGVFTEFSGEGLLGPGLVDLFAEL